MCNILTSLIEFLDKIKQYRQPHELGVIWSEEGMKRLKQYLHNSRNVKEALTKMQIYMVELPEEKPELAVKWHTEILKKKGLDILNYPAYLTETDLAPDELIVEIEGRKFLPDIFRHFGHMERIANIENFLNKGSKRILELGSGTGYLPRLLKEKYKNIKYVVIDIPEMICFSYMRICSEFPDKKILLIDNNSNIFKDDLESYDFIFCPTIFKEQVFNLDYDLFINTASFGEMKSKDVNEWFNDIEKKIKPKYLFTVNRYLNTLIPGQHDWRYEENGSCIFFGKEWDIIDWELEPDFTRCPWNNRFARYLLILAKFKKNINKSQNIKNSNKLLENAKKGTWNTYPLYMTMADNVLNPDLTKTGILFHLWESIRLDENVENLFLMIKYLDTLMRNSNRHFEEYFYYLSKLIEKSKIEDVSEEITIYIKNNLTRFDRNPGFIKLVEVFENYNIVKTQRTYIGLSQAIGVVDLEKDLVGDKEISPFILVSDTYKDIKDKIKIINHS